MKNVSLQEILTLLINEERQAAEGLLREYYLARGKAIHESIMAEDEEDGVDATKDQIAAEEYFSEDGDVDGEEELEGPESLESEKHEETEEDDFEEALADFEAGLDRLKAEYAKIKGEEEGEEHEESHDGEETDLEGFGGVEGDDLQESWDLETVKDTGQKTDGSFIGTGGKATTNYKSPVPAKKIGDRTDGKPVEIKGGVEHTGYEREQHPAVKDNYVGKNVRKKAMDGTEKLSREGDKSAELNSKDGFGSETTPSPFSGLRKKK
jgi:hypothetical protein